MLSWFLFWTLCVGIMAEGCCSCIFMKACPKDIPLHEGCRVHVPTQLALLWAYCSSAASCGLTLPWWSSATGLELEKQQTNACLPFPNPGEAGGMKRARYSTLPSSLQAHGLCWLGWGDSTPKKSFRQAHAGQGWASSRVFCSLAASWSNEHSSATAPLGGADTSVVTVRQSCLQWMWGRWPVLKVCVCVCGGVLHQDNCRSCTVYHKTWLSATWKDLSWSPVTEATLEPSRPQDKTNMMWGHAVSDPLAACGWQARKRWVTTLLLPPHCPFSEAGATTLSHLKQPSIHVLTNAGAGLSSL